MENEKKIIIVNLKELRNSIIGNINKLNLNASGNTANSLSVEETQDGGLLKGRRAFSVLEKGRSAGKVPYNFREIIKEWIINKGIQVDPIPYKRQENARISHKYTPYERGLNSMSYLIARSIREKGTRLHKLGIKQDVYSTELDLTVNNIKAQISALYQLNIKRG